MRINDIIKKLIELESIHGNVPIYYKDWEQNQACEVDYIEFSKDFLVPCNNQTEAKHAEGIVIF